jgi:NADH-quinone oxidoreductase subunit M
VVLAGLQLKMGAYGLMAILLPVLPETVAKFGWLLVALALISLVWGALAALAQRDMKRLVAYTSINHMAYVTLAVAIAAMTADGDVQRLALDGAAVQMVSHGLLTGGMFLMVGILQHQAGTRDIGRFGGLIGRAPVFSLLFSLLAFGSLGLPGLSGFIAEFQVIGASLVLSLWVAAVVVLTLVVTTGVYLRLLSCVLMGEPTAPPRLAPLPPRELWPVVTLTALSVLIGVLPGLLVPAVNGASQLLARF